MKKSLIKLTKNKYVFYVVCLLAILNVLGYFSMRSWECIVMFAAVAYSANCYSKNATIALLAGLFVSNFVFGCNQVKESFTDAMEPLGGLEKAMEKVKNDVIGMQNEEECEEDFEKDKKGNCKKKVAALDQQVKKVVDEIGGLKSGMSGMKILSALKNMGK